MPFGLLHLAGKENSVTNQSTITETVFVYSVICYVDT